MRTLLAYVAGVITGWFLFQILDLQGNRQELEQARREAIQMRQQLAASVQSRQPAEPIPLKPEPDARPDDLTQIRGIGPVFARRLRQAGITSFAQLANTSADALREIVAAEDWQKIEPVRWAQEAAGLAGQ
jgi:predicted flap endonuclease-1-like 5' DNA nuclease